MCLAVPGKITEIFTSGNIKMAKAGFRRCGPECLHRNPAGSKSGRLRYRARRLCI